MSRHTVDTTKKPISKYPEDAYRTSKDGIVLTRPEADEARKFGIN